ncbi:arylsulfatase [Candidatus Poriferisocius sp.]|uniref:arylsulfatase n=1 Tax=Candidatus Poriferisocius sp. TaxID=3101276 RepID=UPI003B59F3D8
MTGNIALSIADSTSTGPGPPFPADAPNVLMIVLDDLGFAQAGCYGSDIDTPNLDRLAQRGVRFTNFHTTAICSPTRACLLTGRNHHRVGMGLVPDLPLNFPGYTGEFPRAAGTLAHVLRDQGWATRAVGKWHLVPWDQRDSGPFHMWPSGLGFERYYGFLNAETNQWTPNLVRDHDHIEPPASPDEGYHLDADLADQAIAQLRQLRQNRPHQPFFLYYATGAPHAPHHAPTEWVDRYRGRFDAGWDAWREQTLARAQDLGVVPADVELSERPPWVEAWDDIDDERRRLYARIMEVYAGFVSHTDHHIGRVLDHLESTGELDETIVMVISDNGASPEGGPHGTWNVMRQYVKTQDREPIADEFAHIHELGGHRAYNHYPWGWAWAGNTPFRRWKRYTFEGGVRDPLIVSWPGCPDPGATRDQYCHVTDLMPTVLDLLGITPPATLDGTEQMTLDGVSLGEVLADPDAAETRTTQYYECWGSRAMYADGWKAVTNHVSQFHPDEMELIVGSHDFATDEWELFDTRSDFTESSNLAEQRPDKLAELVALWEAEAERNQVLPLNDRAPRANAEHMRMPWLSFRTVHHLRPGDKVHELSGPMIFGRCRITAGFDGGVAANASGVLFEQGDWVNGWALFLHDGHLHLAVNLHGSEHRLAAPITAGRDLVAVDLSLDDDRLLVELRDGGEPLTTGTFTIGGPMGPWASDGAFLTVGYARHFPVSDLYQPPAPAPSNFTGLVFDTAPAPEFDFEAELRRAMRHQ